MTTNIRDVMPFEQFSQLVDDLRAPMRAAIMEFGERELENEIKTFVLLTVAAEMLAIGMIARLTEGATEEDTRSIVQQLVNKSYEHLRPIHMGGIQ